MPRQYYAANISGDISGSSPISLETVKMLLPLSVIASKYEFPSKRTWEILSTPSSKVAAFALSVVSGVLDAMSSKRTGSVLGSKENSALKATSPAVITGTVKTHW